MLINRIAKDVGLAPEYIEKIVKGASFRYKVFTIPKKTGGVRLISQPSPELKFLQRWLVANIFEHFPVHDSVYSYRESIGIQDLASVHKKSNYLLRIDLSNFFPSIKARDVAKLLLKNIDLIPFPLSRIDYLRIQFIVCRNGALTIGAPSSPSITNAILYDFDKHNFEAAQKRGAIYSRYADDLYFSTKRPGVLDEIYNDVKKDLENLKSPRLNINEEKTIFSSKKNKRIVTGLIISSEKKVSIGRTKKRLIKTMVYKFQQDELCTEEISYLRGFLSYIHAVEPTFLKSLRQKFGDKTIASILECDLVTKKNGRRKI